MSIPGLLSIALRLGLAAALCLCRAASGAAPSPAPWPRVIFRDGVDALQLYVSIAALSYFYLGNSHTLSAVFGRNLAAPDAREQRLAHMTDVILGYLRPALQPRLERYAKERRGEHDGQRERVLQARAAQRRRRHTLTVAQAYPDG